MPNAPADRRLFAPSPAFPCPLCVGASADPPPAWSYQGTTGPEHWGRLSQDYRTCAQGTQQSPIDLSPAIESHLAPVVISYRAVPPQVCDNGRYLLVNAPPGDSVRFADVRYNLLQFRFHHPSEHAVSGTHFRMEAHFVNQVEDGSICVLGTFIEPGASNPVLARLLKTTSTRLAPDTAVPDDTIDPRQLLPHSRAYYHYIGSLTTPPCSEAISWVLFTTPVQASEAEITKYAAVFGNCARPLQPRNQRLVVLAGGGSRHYRASGNP